MSLVHEFHDVDWKSNGRGDIAPYSASLASTNPAQGYGGMRVPVHSQLIERAYLIWNGYDFPQHGGDGVYDNETVLITSYFSSDQPRYPVTGTPLGARYDEYWGPGASDTYVADITWIFEQGLIDEWGIGIEGLSQKPGHSAAGVSVILIYDDQVPTNNRDITIYAANLDERTQLDFPALERVNAPAQLQLHVADGQSYPDAQLVMQSRGVSIRYEDASNLFDGHWSGMRTDTRTSTGSLWDIHDFDIGRLSPTPNSPLPSPTDRLTVGFDGWRNDSLIWVAAVIDQPHLANTPPVAPSKQFTIDEDTSPLNILLPDIFDADNQPTSISILTSPQFGQATIASSYKGITYFPNRNFNGRDEIVYLAFDGIEYSAPATITINVRPVNDAPTLSAQSISLAENTPVGQAVTKMIGTDIDDVDLVYSIYGGNQLNAFSMDPKTGNVTVRDSKPLDFETTKQFNLQVRVTDPKGLYAEQLLRINLTDVIEYTPISLQAPASITTRDTTLTITLLSSSQFNASTFDLNSVSLVINGKEFFIARNKKGVALSSLSDVNRDGLKDLTLTFTLPATSLSSGDFSLRLTGSSNNQLVEGNATGKVTLHPKDVKGNGKK